MKIKKQKEEIEEKLERYRFKICKYISAFGKEERGFSYAKRVEIDNFIISGSPFPMFPYNYNSDKEAFYSVCVSIYDNKESKEISIHRKD